MELEAKLDTNEVTLELDDAAREWIAARGYDPKMGARPMARLILNRIKKPLAEELLFGKLSNAVGEPASSPSKCNDVIRRIGIDRDVKNGKRLVVVRL